MNSNPKLALFAVLCAALALAGCSCEDKTKKQFPKLELPAGSEGEQVSSIDFGKVQIDQEHVRPLKVRNTGNAALTLSQLKVSAPFGVKEVPPLTLGVSEELVLYVTYRPTVADQLHTGALVIASNDKDRPEVSVALSGRGVQAVALFTPNPIDFKDVYVGESGKVTFTLTNAGSNDLNVLDAKLSSDAQFVSADLSTLKKAIPAAGSASAELTFAPTQILEALAGSLEVTLDPLQGGKVSVPLKGRAIKSVPRLCFKFDDTGTESCTKVDAAPGADSNLNVNFGSLCDSSLYGPDAGALACTAATGQRTGKLYFKNEGNVPVTYSVRWVQNVDANRNRCDAGYEPPDFRFSNVPATADGGLAEWTQASTKLPQNAGDPKPWETSPVTLTYRPTSRCYKDAADQALVLWSRQGEPPTRAPSLLSATVTGTSKLPHATPVDWSCGSLGNPQAVPCKFDFHGVANAGSAPVRVAKVELWEEFFVGDAGTDAGGPNGGYFQLCDYSNPYSDCHRFGWDGRDGGDPNQLAPHVIPAPASPGLQEKRVLGTLVFGPHGATDCVNDGGACPNKLYRLYAIVRTDDPYAPEVLVKLQGVAAPP